MINLKKEQSLSQKVTINSNTKENNVAIESENFMFTAGNTKKIIDLRKE